MKVLRSDHLALNKIFEVPSVTRPNIPNSYMRQLQYKIIFLSHKPLSSVFMMVRDYIFINPKRVANSPSYPSNRLYKNSKFDIVLQRFGELEFL